MRFVNTQELLNIFLILGFIVITSCIVFITFYLVQALKAIAQMASSIDETTQNIKEKVQLKALAAVPALLVALVSRIFKRRG